MKSLVLIIGAGQIGIAFKKVLLKNPKVRVFLWDKNPKKVKNQKPLKEIVPLMDFIFIAVPAGAVFEVAQNLYKIIQRKTIIISLTKGLDPKSGKTSFEVLKEFLPQQPLAVLSGPTLAEELKKGEPAIAIIACRQKKIFQRIKKIFEKTSLRLKFSTDEKGVSLSGVLKNIYAIVLGIADGLHWGNNLKGWLVVEILKEWLSLSDELKISPQIILGEAGLGDFIATGFSPVSRHHLAGKDLVNLKRKKALKSEGAESLFFILKRLKRKKYPILNCLSKILQGKKASILSQCLDR